MLVSCMYQIKTSWLNVAAVCMCNKPCFKTLQLLTLPSSPRSIQDRIIMNSLKIDLEVVT